MKTKLLGVVAACVLALTAESASAATFNYSIDDMTPFAFSQNQTIFIKTLSLPTPQPLSIGDMLDVTINTVAIDANAVMFNLGLGYDCVVCVGIHFDGTWSANNIMQGQFAQQGSGLLSYILEQQNPTTRIEILATLTSLPPGTTTLTLNSIRDQLVFTHIPTPLPATLPLFATGLGMFYAALRCRKKILRRRLSAGTNSGGTRSSLRSPPSTVASASQI